MYLLLVIFFSILPSIFKIYYRYFQTAASIIYHFRASEIIRKKLKLTRIIILRILLKFLRPRVLKINIYDPMLLEIYFKFNYVCFIIWKYRQNSNNQFHYKLFFKCFIVFAVYMRAQIYHLIFSYFFCMLLKVTPQKVLFYYDGYTRLNF